MYKQIIIARKDLEMSPGKLAAQVSHGSLAFLSKMIRENAESYSDTAYPVWGYNHYSNERERIEQRYRRGDLNQWASEARERGDLVFHARPVNPNEPYGKLELCEPELHYHIKFNIDADLYKQWFNGTFTKCVLQVKNKNQLLKAKTMAEELEMKENEDFFLIWDNCRTELEPEENGNVLTCIGFKPMNAEIIDKIGKKYQLYT